MDDNCVNDIHYWKRKQRLCRVQNSLPSVKNRAFSKDLLCRVLHSANNCTRQRRALGKGLLCRAPDSRQNLYTRHRLPAKRRSITAFFAERLLLGTRQRFVFFKKNSLPSAPDLALGKDVIFFFKFPLCRVHPQEHSAKKL